MGVASHDTYLHRESVIHRWSPRLKLVSLLVLMFAFATVRQPILIPWMLGLAAGLYLLSGLPLAFLGQRLSYPGLFVLALVVLLPLTVGDTVLGQWGWLTLRQEGLEATLLIVGRFLSILTLGFILLGTTPFLTLLQAMRSLGLPTILADMTLLSYRQALQQLAMLAGNLLIRSYEQSERVYKAMRLRGYGYGVKRPKPSLADQPSPLSWGLAGGVLAAAVGLVVAEGLLRP